MVSLEHCGTKNLYAHTSKIHVIQTIGKNEAVVTQTPNGGLRADPSHTMIQTLHAAEGLPTSFSCEHWILPAIAQLIAAAASC